MKATTSDYKQQRAANCNMYLEHLAEEVLKISTVYGIADAEKAKTIAKKLSAKGCLCKDNRAYQRGGMLSAMNHYVRFLQQDGNITPS